MNIVGTIKDHPVEVGLGVFAVGFLLLMMRGSGGSAQSSDGGLGAAYYGALAQQSQDSTALAITQSNNTAATAQTQIGADAYTSTQNTWASTTLAETNSNNQAAISMAPYATESQLIAALGEVAQTPPTVTTSKSNGFFGIGGGTKTTVTPNPSATGAASALQSLINGFNAGH